MSDNLPAVQGTALQSTLLQNITNFDKAMEIARALSQSNMVPATYRDKASGPPNVLIALEISQRMGLSILTVMQNLDVIQGRPAWSAKFQAGQVNASGKFRGSLRYEFEDRPEVKVDYEVYGKKDLQTGLPAEKIKKTATVKDRACRCWAIEAQTGEKIIGPWFSLEMAYRFGLFDRNGSQWPIDPENMLMKRAASRFVSNFCPEVTLGIMTQDDAADAIDVEFKPIETPPIVEPKNDTPAPAPETPAKGAAQKAPAEAPADKAPETPATGEAKTPPPISQPRADNAPSGANKAASAPPAPPVDPDCPF
jgi:hypothetical protein